MHTPLGPRPALPLFSPLAFIAAVLMVTAAPFAASRAADAAAKPSPAFRAAMKRFLVAQKAPETMGEQMSFSVAEQILAPLASRGVAISEPMQNLVLEEARKEFGKRFSDAEYLTDLYAGIYAEHFSDKEMTELAVFWESPVARKLFDKGGALNQSLLEKIQSAITPTMADFQTRMDKRLRESGMLGDAPKP